MYKDLFGRTLYDISQTHGSSHIICYRFRRKVVTEVKVQENELECIEKSSVTNNINNQIHVKECFGHSIREDATAAENVYCTITDYDNTLTTGDLKNNGVYHETNNKTTDKLGNMNLLDTSTPNDISNGHASLKPVTTVGDYDHLNSIIFNLADQTHDMPKYVHEDVAKAIFNYKGDVTRAIRNDTKDNQPLQYFQQIINNVDDEVQNTYHHQCTRYEKNVKERELENTKCHCLDPERNVIVIQPNAPGDVEPNYISFEIDTNAESRVNRSEEHSKSQTDIGQEAIKDNDSHPNNISKTTYMELDKNATHERQHDYALLHSPLANESRTTDCTDSNNDGHDYYIIEAGCY